ncbi:hypothetical protein ERL59_08520 [Chengkuizengella sp. YPA3-1-1]|uniref:Integrase catalytic domain-containing protein n=1 Tax=Chengkuizengella marina TaxID=2507566 RepID=A0A6N9PZR7_9BACL|nr:hypothetical protein [Chengkuizengella marina]
MQLLRQLTKIFKTEFVRNRNFESLEDLKIQLADYVQITFESMEYWVI